MIVRSSATILRIATLSLVLGSVVSAQENSPEVVGDTQRFVSVGKLTTVRSGGEQGEQGDQYVLLDEAGEVMSSLRPASGVNLAKYVGQEVGVTARTLVDSETPILLAENVTPFGFTRQDDAKHAGGQVTPAAWQEEVPYHSSVLVESDPVPLEYGPIVDSPIVDESYFGGPACESCGSAYCGSTVACPCGLPGKFWIRSEYLIWWTDGMDTPALVTTSPAGTPPSAAGVLGASGTTVLYGDEAIFSDSHSGARFRIGKWCDQCNWLGFETDYFFLSDEDQDFSACNVGPQIYARPFFNTQLGQQDSELVQFPGTVTGSIHVDTDTSLWSIGPRLRINLACEQLAGCGSCDPCSVGGYRMDLLLGYRFMRLDDSLRIRETLATVDANNPTYFALTDSFDTSNDFHGADLGFLWEGYRGPWSLEFIGRIGIGSTRQNVVIDGATSTSAAGSTFNDPAGLLALSSNIGNYSRNEFTVLPEASVTLGYALTPRSRFLVGYTFIYWNKVVRAGGVIDTTVNEDLIPPPQNTNGPARPAFAFTDTSYWAQGLSLGLEYRW